MRRSFLSLQRPYYRVVGIIVNPGGDDRFHRISRIPLDMDHWKSLCLRLDLTELSFSALTLQLSVLAADVQEKTGLRIAPFAPDPNAQGISQRCTSCLKVQLFTHARDFDLIAWPETYYQFEVSDFPVNPGWQPDCAPEPEPRRRISGDWSEKVESLKSRAEFESARYHSLYRSHAPRTPRNWNQIEKESGPSDSEILQIMKSPTTTEKTLADLPLGETRFRELADQLKSIQSLREVASQLIKHPERTELWLNSRVMAGKSPIEMCIQNPMNRDACLNLLRKKR